jgi:hypothetical protein
VIVPVGTGACRFVLLFYEKGQLLAAGHEQHSSLFVMSQML